MKPIYYEIGGYQSRCIFSKLHNIPQAAFTYVTTLALVATLKPKTLTVGQRVMKSFTANREKKSACRRLF